MPDISRRNAVHGLVLLAAGATLTMASQTIAAETVPLAIKGYDPVAYFTVGRPVEGSPKFEYEWDELRYRFSREENLKLFKADPVRYAPQFANFCAMALTNGELIEADPKNWLISDGKLYVFGKSIGPDLFRKNLDKNVAKANQNRALIGKH
jgi:YHS domain-containing protein